MCIKCGQSKGKEHLYVMYINRAILNEVVVMYKQCHKNV